MSDRGPTGDRWHFERRPGPAPGSPPKSASRTLALNVKLTRETLTKAIQALDAVPDEIAVHRVADAFGEAHHQALLAARFLASIRGVDGDGDDA